MRLATKLTLAFLFITFLTAGLMYALTRRTTLANVSHLAREQEQAEVELKLTQYHVDNGSWDGVLAFFGFPDLPPLAAEGVPLGDAELPPPPLPLRPPPDGLLPDIPPTIGLVDANGLVRIPVPGQLFPQQVVEIETVENTTPLESNGELLGYMVHAPFPAELTRKDRLLVDNINRSLLTTTVIATTLAVITGMGLSAYLTRPIKAMTIAVQRMADGDRSSRVAVRNSDETGELAKAFNYLSDALEASSRQRQRMTADIAHDLRTPIGAIAGSIEALRDGIFEPTHERLDAIHAEAYHMLALVTDLQMLAAEDASDIRLSISEVEPQQLLAQTVDVFTAQATQQDIDLSYQDLIEQPCVLQVDEDRLARVLRNLVSNALRHTPKKGSITLSSRCDDSGVHLAVDDTGSGISAEDLPHIFDRFYQASSTRSNADGESGLGLAIAKTIVEAHNGMIRADSTPEIGTTFTISLPLKSSSNGV